MLALIFKNELYGRGKER